MGQLFRGYDFWHTPGAHAGVALAIRGRLALVGRATVVHKLPGRAVLVSLNPPDSQPLLIVATYWPSGSDAGALREREQIEN